MTVSELAPLIEQGKVSPLELVDAQISRIEALDDVLRAYIYVNAGQARSAAKAATSEIASGGYRGPLHGVTVAHKDIIDVRGLPTTAGSKIMSGYIAKEDATVSARLRSAGAICLGKLNLVEFASGSMGLYGFARNPYNLAASPGGSSSGSGVAAAAGLATIVTGTDTGGSVRNPAAYCALAGLRPTYGRVSRFGCVPLSWSQDSIGPMGRSVADLAAMLNIMAGADRYDPTAALKTVTDFTLELEQGLDGLRLGVPEGFFYDDLNAEVEGALRQAIHVMEDLGAEVKSIAMPAAEYASAASWVIAYSESFVYHHHWFEQRSTDYTPAFYHKITAAGLTSAEERIISQRVRQLVTREFAQVMRGVDVIVTPTSRTLASASERAIPAERRKLPWSADMSSVTRPASLAGYPALSVPVGFAADNTPIGMQLIGRPWEEPTIFRVGYAYERASGWTSRRPPAFPDQIPPRFNASPSSGEAAQTPGGAVSPGWVMDMARLLELRFVSEDDARQIAPLLSPVKEQLRAAQRDLKLDMEPPTRPAGVF